MTSQVGNTFSHLLILAKNCNVSKKAKQNKTKKPLKNKTKLNQQNTEPKSAYIFVEID